MAEIDPKHTRRRLSDMTRDQKASIRKRALVILRRNKFLPHELAVALKVKPRQLRSLARQVHRLQSEVIAHAG